VKLNKENVTWLCWTAAQAGDVRSSERTQESREDVIARLSHGTHASSVTCHMPDPHPTTEPQYS
jgi:hypothetical protein